MGAGPCQAKPSLVQPERAVKLAERFTKSACQLYIRSADQLFLCKVSFLVIYQVRWPVIFIYIRSADQLYISRSAYQLYISRSADQLCLYQVSWSVIYQAIWPFHQISWPVLYQVSWQVQQIISDQIIVHQIIADQIIADQLSGQLTSSPDQLTSYQVSWPVHQISWPVIRSADQFTRSADQLSGQLTSSPDYSWPVIRSADQFTRSAESYEYDIYWEPGVWYVFGAGFWYVVLRAISWAGVQCWAPWATVFNLWWSPGQYPKYGGGGVGGGGRTHPLKPGRSGKQVSDRQKIYKNVAESLSIVVVSLAFLTFF
jgi:hypothetical protein